MFAPTIPFWPTRDLNRDNAYQQEIDFHYVNTYLETRETTFIRCLNYFLQHPRLLGTSDYWNRELNITYRTLFRLVEWGYVPLPRISLQHQTFVLLTDRPVGVSDFVAWSHFPIVKTDIRFYFYYYLLLSTRYTPRQIFTHRMRLSPSLGIGARIFTSIR